MNVTLLFPTNLPQGSTYHTAGEGPILQWLQDSFQEKFPEITFQIKHTAQEAADENPDLILVFTLLMGSSGNNWGALNPVKDTIRHMNVVPVQTMVSHANKHEGYLVNNADVASRYLDFKILQGTDQEATYALQIDLTTKQEGYQVKMVKSVANPETLNKLRTILTIISQ